MAIVLGYGRDAASQQALGVAVDLAQRLSAQLHAVHGIDLSDYPIDPDAVDWEDQAGRVLTEEQEHLRAALAGTEVDWTYHASHGDPVGLISAVAEEVDALMIIVGTRGEGLVPAIERMFGGSVSHGVIQRQHRPVLVVPHAERAGRE